MEHVKSETEKKEYEKYVKKVTPVHSLPANMAKAFLMGGLICVLGQFLVNAGLNYGLDQEKAGSWCSLILVFLSALLTGLNVYPKLAKFGGAGTLVPITGFANSIAAAAVEYQTEGEVFGKGSKIFTIAGPVILYGIFSSWVLGLIYWVGKIASWW
ncbi:MAG: SpoVA/SpoVAEb family sporulation membrane protein [Ruminococcus sp.]|jgi:stage V sporulation protein AC